MKTTSYKISKKLKEAGFEAEGDFGYRVPDSLNDLKAYGLETILDALPAFVEHNKTMYYFWLWNDGIGYYPNCDRYSGNSQYDMENGIYEFSDNESLADTAGRMWLMLKEKGVV